MKFHLEPCECGYALTLFYPGATVVEWYVDLESASAAAAAFVLQKAVQS